MDETSLCALLERALVPEPPIGPVADPVHGDGPEQSLVESLPVGRAAVRPVGDQWPERLQYLGRRLEADRPRLHPSLAAACAITVRIRL